MVSKEYMQDPINDLSTYALEENIDINELKELINSINVSLETK